MGLCASDKSKRLTVGLLKRSLESVRNLTPIRRYASKLNAENPLQEVTSQQADKQERPDPVHRVTEEPEVSSRIPDLHGQKSPIRG